jgi:hypothetical protein
MATQKYLSGRKTYARPQAMLFANNSGLISDGKIVPDGVELEDFIILSDDNRQPIQIANTRIEQRQRMINGRMRSYHIADKINISTSWTLLPSRSFNVIPEFEKSEVDDAKTGKVKNLVTSVEIENMDRSVRSSGSPFYQDQKYTTDGGAGGADLLDWYRSNQGSFWVFLSYDNPYNLENQMNRLSEYSEVVEVFFSSFEHSIEKRGGTNHDLWSVSFSLEEV